MQMKRITITIDSVLLSQVKELSDKQKRSISSMACLLLQSALKEKLRKKNAAKESNT